MGLDNVNVFQLNKKKSEDFFDNPYYGTVKKYLIYMGQYPYQKTRSRVIYLSLLFTSTITLIIPQLHQLGHTIKNRNLDQIIMCLPPLFTNCVCFTKLFNLQINKEKFRKIFDLIRHDWRILTIENEKKVLQELAEQGSKFGELYRNYIAAVLCLFLSLPLAPVFLDIIMPQNQSRQRNTLFEVDYLVDNDEYFYPIYIHAAWSSLFTVLILVTVDSMYMLITHHACALFALCGYRVRNLTGQFQEDTDVNTEEEYKILYQKLRYCAISHAKAIEFVDFMAASSSTSYLLQIGINMIAISITGVQTVIKLHQFEEAARFGVFTIAQSIHLFFNSLPGQKLLNYSTDLADVIYDAEWYRTPIKIQKMLLTMQVRCRRPCKLTAGGLYEMNMENFGKIVKTSMSYFTMFLSFRE